MVVFREGFVGGISLRLAVVGVLVVGARVVGLVVGTSLGRVGVVGAALKGVGDEGFAVVGVSVADVAPVWVDVVVVIPAVCCVVGAPLSGGCSDTFAGTVGAAVEVLVSDGLLPVLWESFVWPWGSITLVVAVDVFTWPGLVYRG